MFDGKRLMREGQTARRRALDGDADAALAKDVGHPGHNVKLISVGVDDDIVAFSFYCYTCNLGFRDSWDDNVID